MAEIIVTQSISPTNFEYQEYSSADLSLINQSFISSNFNPEEDYVEFFIYDLNNTILVEVLENYQYYTLLNNVVNLDPVADIRRYSYEQGQFNVLYNFLKPRLASSPTQTYYIEEISSDRTEIRLNTTKILNGDVIGSTTFLSNEINNSPEDYLDFYLDFGNNKLVIAVNVLLDSSNQEDPSVLIKLYEPLPEEFDVKAECWAVEKVAESVAYYISATTNFDDIDNKIYLKGPNINLNINDQINNSTAYNNYQSLKSTNQSQGSGSFSYQINSLLAESGIELNIDYSNYANFIHFSSAQTRLENFYYKLSLIEEYQASASIALNAPTNYYVSSSNVIYQNKIDEIVTNFDGYEYYLYYNSGSSSWPKTNSTPPYINASTGSIAGLAFLASQSIEAELYDQSNDNALILAIPDYLRDDPDNYNYELFIEMIGQHFDNIFVYMQDITKKYDADNRLNYGVSKDIVADVLRDMGIKIYQNNFSTDDLYSALLGFTPSGSLYNLPYTTGSLPTPSGYEYINTYITASSTSSLLPTEDINKSIYKRIYHNLPYLLKKKGTVEGLRALVTIYGIPDTILQVNEFGGQDKIIKNDYDLWFDQFNYTLSTQGTNYVTSSFTLNSNWNSADNAPAAVEFRFKTTGLPTNTGYYSQSLWSTDQGALLRLRYTGSGYTSGSYSGSIPNPYNEFALLEFIPDVASPSTSASVYLPFFDGGWWSVLINRSSQDFTLYSGNKNYLGSDVNYVAYLSSSTINGNDAPWITGTTAYLGSGSLGRSFSGSLQEYRFYTQTLNTSSFEDYIMYPYSIDANGVNTAPEALAFRATLGGELYTASLSIHPKVTGSWTTTQSFGDNTSTFKIYQDATFTANTESVYLNQFPAGIKNRVSNKVRQQNEVLPYSGSKESNLPQNTALSPFISVQQDVPVSGSYTPNIDYVEVAFSPQNEINNDIAGQLGYFNLGDYIGDPRLVSSSAESYPELDAIRNYYFEKYTSNYNIWDYIRLVKYFDNSLFKMIQDWVPARTSLASGVVIKQTVLERNKYPVPQLDTETTTSFYSGSTWNTPGVYQNIEYTGSIDMYEITGSTGITMPSLVPTYDFRPVTSSTGQTYIAQYGTPLNPMLNLTQSWLGSTPSLSGSVAFTQSNAQEFFNGELSGSNLVVEDGELNPLNPVKHASTQLLTYNITGSNDVINGTGYPAIGNIYWAFTEGTSGGVPTTKDYVNEIWINETSNNSIDILNALENFQVGDVINFNVKYNFFDGLVSPPITKNIITPIESITPITADVWRIGLPFNSSTTINNDNFTFTVLYNSGSSNVILNPFLNDVENYSVSEYNPLINNAVESRPNAEFFDVDFSTNAITAVNGQNIISASRGSGSATPSTVPASNYTTARIAVPRYIGKELTSARLNEWTEGDTSYGKTANVSNPETNFVYFNYVGGSSPEWGNQNQDRTIVNIRYIIDQNGNVTKPINDSSGINLGTIQQTFEEDKSATLVLDDNDVFGVNLNALNGSWPIFKSGYRIEPIIYTQTASYDNNGNVVSFGYTSSINFTQGQQGPTASVNDYQMTTFGVGGQQIDNIGLPIVIDFDSPFILGASASFFSGSSDEYYKPTGSIGSLSGSGVVLTLQAYLESVNYYLARATYAIQKSTNGGSSWTTVATRQINYQNSRTGTVTYVENNATTSSLYRVACTTYQNDNPYDYDIVELNENTYFKVTQTPLPGTGICTAFWRTGSASNILQASPSSGGLNQFYGQRQTSIERSGFNPIVNDFELQPYDEIRFQGTENLAFIITRVYSSASVVTLDLNRNIPSGTNLNYFFVRRYVEDPSSIILDVDKPAGGSSGGILKPQYLSSAVESNLDTIIQNLKNQNLI